MPKPSEISGADIFRLALWDLNIWKQINWQVVTVDTLVSPKPAFVFALWIASNGSGEADAIIYDGMGAGSLRFIHIDTVDEAMDSLVYPTPLYFRSGIYIDVVTNVQQVGVQYLVDPTL